MPKQDVDPAEAAAYNELVILLNRINYVATYVFANGAKDGSAKDGQQKLMRELRKATFSITQIGCPENWCPDKIEGCVPCHLETYETSLVGAGEK